MYFATSDKPLDMRIMNCLIVLLLTQHCFAQQVIRKVLNSPNGDRQVYFILASDTSTLHGRYMRQERTSRTEGYYNNGIQEGVWTEYAMYPRKHIRIQGPYKNGLKHGLWTVYLSKKKVKAKGYFENDEPVGYWRFYNSKGEVEEEGNYTNGIRSGKWSFYTEKGEMVQEYDYTAKNVVHDNSLAELKQKQFKVINGRDTTLSLLQRPPVYIGGRSKLGKERFIQIPMETDSLSVTVYFTIDSAGRVRNYDIPDRKGFPYDQEAIYTIRLLNSTWMPAMLNGKRIDVRHSLTIRFSKIKLRKDPLEFYRDYLPESSSYRSLSSSQPFGPTRYAPSVFSIYACRVQIL